MGRSRSSFDLKNAIATAAALTPEAAPAPRHYAGVALVSFGRPESPGTGTPGSPEGAGSLGAGSPAAAGVPGSEDRGPISAPRAHAHGGLADEPTAPATPGDAAPAAAQPGPPKLPDLSAVVSPILRCEKIVAWIGEATGATDVFLADAAGLPLAGAIQEAEARLAGAGVVATAIASLASALPGSASPLFEVHIGEGPFFQLIGFQAGAALYVIGLTRPTPLTPRQAHAIRLACRHALGETLRGGA